MGRPTKAPDEKRTERLAGVRLTSAERHHVELLATRAGLDLAEFSRRAILGQRITPARRKADDRALVELNRAGVNLNQIARAVNRGRDLPDHFAAVLDDIRAAVEKVVGDGS